MATGFSSIYSGLTMLKYIKHNKIDRQKWDKCIANSNFPIVYAESWYLDCVSPNWDALVLDDYQAVMPLPVKRKFGIKFLAHPFYCQQLGIFGSENTDESIFHQKVKQSFPFGWYSLNESNNISGTYNNILERVTCVLPLNKSYEELAANYSQNTRRNLKKAYSFNLQLDTNVSVTELIELKKKYSKAKINSKHYEILQNIITQSIDKQQGTINGIRNENGDLLAAVFWLFSHERCIYLSANSSDEGSEKKAMFALIDSYIKMNAGKNISIDFEGSVIEGIARFYTGFGAAKHNFQYFSFNHLPYPFKLLIRI
jgi:hypothetical protein